MLCNKCGYTLPEESIFCLKCGNKLIMNKSVDNSLDVNEVKSVKTSSLIIKDKIQTSNQNSKPKKASTYYLKLTVAIVVFIFFIIFSMYSGNIGNATKLYDDNEYRLAYNAIENIIPIGTSNKLLFHRIKIMDECGTYVRDFETNAFPLSKERDMRDALIALINGYMNCEKSKSAAEMYDINNKIEEVRTFYLDNLKTYYKISETKANELISLDTTEWIKEVDKRYEIGESVINYSERQEIAIKEKEIKRQSLLNNPIANLEITAGWTFTDDGNYTYVRGRVKNIGENNIGYFEITAEYLDRDNIVIDTDYTNSGQTIRPGNLKEFEIMHQYDNEYKSANIYISKVTFE